MPVSETNRFDAWTEDDILKEVRRIVGSHVVSSRLPVNVYELSSYFGVQDIIGVHTACEGYIARSESGGLKICYRIDRPYYRTRFTVAHELGHVLFSNIIGTRLDDAVEDSAANAFEERVANRIAAELLMPISPFLKHFEGLTQYTSFVRRSITQLAGLFGVSRTATVLRLLEVPQTNSFLLEICRRAAKIDVKFRKTGDISLRHSRNETAEELLRAKGNSAKHVDIMCDSELFRLECDFFRYPNSSSNYRPIWWAVGWLPKYRRGQGTSTHLTQWSNLQRGN